MVVVEDFPLITIPGFRPRCAVVGGFDYAALMMMVFIYDEIVLLSHPFAFGLFSSEKFLSSQLESFIRLCFSSIPTRAI